MTLHDKRVLITGAKGFIGRRLAERLMREEGAHVRAMVRPTAPAVGTIHELPLSVEEISGAEVCVADITDAGAARRAVAGCDVIVHCAALQGSGDRRAKPTLDEFRRVNVGGTLNLLQAARGTNLLQFIHISTINVHGYPPPDEANADSPLVFTGDFYSVSKAEAERTVWEFARTDPLPITVIRPACTYGPRSGAWTLQPIRRVRRGSPVLIGRGDGICNAIYIDNLIDLILLAMKNKQAIGRAFIGAEGRGVAWRNFYGAYAKMVGVSHLRSLPRSLALGVAAASEFASRFTGRPPFLSRASVEFYSHQVVYDISKSRELLGYTPRVSFEEGMRRTEEWLRSRGDASFDHSDER